MTIALWLLNLFSLFSCFGALIVVAFIAVQSRRRVYWKLFAIVAMFVISYASGIIQFISQNGLAYPEMDPTGIVPVRQGLNFYLESFLYLVLFYLIPSVTHELLGIKSRVGYLILSPFLIAGLIVPSILLFVAADFLVRSIRVMVVFKLLVQIVLVEYPLVLIVKRRELLPVAVGGGLAVMALITGSTIVPLMMIEDLLVVLSGLPAYNIAEAVGFLAMNTAILFLGISYISVSVKKKIEPLPLLDVSRRYGLTERETEVLAELVAGARYKEIGQKFAISPETVKTHVSRIYRKLGVSAKQELKYKIRDFLS